MSLTDQTVLTGLPEDERVFTVRSVTLTVDPAPHPFYLQERDAIAANWESEVAAQPAFYDGQILLHREIRLSNGAIEAVSHLTGFSTFLWWRRQPGRAGAAHLFGAAVVVSSDGAIIAVRMSEHTANPGKVYCAAGSLDASDIDGNHVDLNANMARELMEETGLDLTRATAGEVTYGLWRQRSLTLFRFYHFAEDAETLMAEIRTHMASDHEQEIAGPVAIWSKDPAAHDYGPFMPAVLDLYFSTERQEGRRQ